MSHENYIPRMKDRYIPISINTKHLKIEELANKEGILQARIITLIVSDQKHLGKPEKLEIWNDKGKLAFLDTITKTIIYSPAVKEKLHAAHGEVQVQFVHKEGEEYVDLGWAVNEDEGQAFQQIIEQQRAVATDSKKNKDPVSKTRETPPAAKLPRSSLHGRVGETPPKSSKMTHIISRFYLALSQITSKAQAAKHVAQKQEDQQRRDSIKHTEDARTHRKEELKKQTDKHDSNKAETHRTRGNKEVKSRVSGTSEEAKKDPPSTANKGLS